MAQGEEDRLMNSEEVAAVLGVNDSRVRQLARAGLLIGRRVGRDWVFTLADVEEYQQRRPPRGRPPRDDSQ